MRVFATFVTARTMPAAAEAPDWRPLVEQYLRPWATTGLSVVDVDRAEAWALNASAFSATGSWRARTVNGQLYVKMLRVHRHWAERASVLRMLWMACCEEGSAALTNDVDLVYAHSDVDPTPPPQRCNSKRRRQQRGRPPCVATRQLPLFTNSHNRGHGGLPAPEFTWVGWGSTAPWCQQTRTLDDAARVSPWASRDQRLYFSGGLDNGHHRKALRALSLSERAAGRHSELLVRDVGSQFHRWGQFDRQQPAEIARLLGRNTTSNERDLERLHVAPVSASAACAHQYAINVPGFGYSSRLRTLLRCGCAVVHVSHPSSEFFQPLLRDSEHLFYLSGREPVRDALLPLLRRLRANSTHAAAVAAAGRRFAQTYLAFPAVVGYFRSLLEAYGGLLQRGSVAARRSSAAELLEAGYSRVSSEADLLRITGLCDTCKSSKRILPPSSCVRRPRVGVHRRPLPLCTLFTPPGGGRCFDPRCCKGWDCATRSLGCE